MKTLAIIILTLSISTGLVWGGEDDITLTVSRHYPDIIPILRECLEFIDDSSVIYNDPSDRDNYLTESVPAIYQLRSAQTDADDSAQAAQEQADRMRERAERCRRETELHKRIVEMIKKLEPKEKKK